MASGTGSADRITGVGTGLEATLITRNSLGVGTGIDIEVFGAASVKKQLKGHPWTSFLGLR